MSALQIALTQAHQIGTLPELERSAGQAFLVIPELAFVASDSVMSEAEHQRFVELGTSWVACVDDLCRGFLCAERFASDLHIWELAVHADVQGQGIGKALINHVLAFARRELVATVTLTTFREVAFNAPFYEGLGFQCLDTEAVAQDARLRDTLLAEAAHGLPAESRCAMRVVL